MRPLGLVLDPLFERHDTGPSHPERPERVRILRRQLGEAGLVERFETVAPREAEDEDLLLVHDPDHLRRVRHATASGRSQVDSMDTAIGKESEFVARNAAGSVLALARATLRGELAGGFAAVRPPGHHAERNLAMGFCLYNSVAIAARDLVVRQGLSRVAVVDWDVHHGNGTQHIFEEDPTVLYFSCHQWPLYPGTGAREETGRGAGVGTTVNVPLAAGSGDREFLAALRDECVPALERFRPEMIFISAGFDAHHKDPLAALTVSTAAYGDATRLLCDAAKRLSDGRLVSVLEGGYSLEGLADSTRLHLETMLAELSPDR